jgi:hypothetical protein
MSNSIFYKYFIDSLRDDQLKDYSQYSINQQKDWYITYLEAHFSIASPVDNNCSYSNILCPVPNNKNCKTCKMIPEEI